MMGSRPGPGITRDQFCDAISQSVDQPQPGQIQMDPGVDDMIWIKADQAAKSTGKKTNYQVYGLTKQAGQITAGKPKSVDEPCPDTLMVSLSSKSKDGVIGLAATCTHCRGGP